MCRKVIILVFFVLLPGLVLTSKANADLVGLWRFDETSGTIAHDVSGNGNDGTLVGNPQWVAGKIGGALEFNGTDSMVDIPYSPDMTPSEGTTISAWVFPTDTSRACIVGQFEGYGMALFTGLQLKSVIWGSDWVMSDVTIPENEWSHIAMTWDVANDERMIFLNGELVGTRGDSAVPNVQNNLGIGLWVGWPDAWGDDSFMGIIDDVQVHNLVLTEDEIKIIMKGEGYAYALAPRPANGALHPDTWINLSWSPGDFAVSHDVYIGENFDDVNAGSESTFQSNQTSTFLVVGFPGFTYPEGLVPGTTYYWRIDEVNDTEPNSPWKGDVWSFSVPPKTAYNPNPADGAELVALDVQLGWTAGFRAKLHTVYFGDNFDEVNNAAGGLPQGAATYTPGTLKLAKTYYWRVDEFDAINTYKGNVWSFTSQGAVGNPDPSNGAMDVKHTPTLTWSPSVYAASHQVYFGDDKDAVKNADTGSPEYKGTSPKGDESYEPGKLLWDAIYYWRIDEVNNANPDSPWKGPLWSFTTANFLVVDDFEDYDIGNNEIWWVWKDGLGYAAHGNEPAYPGNGTGSAVGDESTGSYCEETIVHGGSQSMPLFYDNSVLKYSEVEKTLTYPRDWTENGVSTLTIWFRGIPDNAAETLYVALNGSAVVSYDNPNAAQMRTWTKWNIDLQAFADQGVNLTNVNTIALGLGNKKNPQAGGSGTMYFDDIRLYPPAP
ncbi:MAG: LamG-like jellyroll fold domain-containing protein [Sedimentisphaerales bacterium]